MTTDFIFVTSGDASAQHYSVILEEQTGLSLADVCRACAIEIDFVLALVEEGIVTPHSPDPAGSDPALWRFSGMHLHRAKVAVRLHQDLGVNLPGAALALQLMDELRVLRQAAAAAATATTQNS